MRHLGLKLLVICSSMVFLSAHAQVAVRVDKPAKLFAQPSEKSMILTEVGGRTAFRALEQSPDRKWIFISDGLRYGWIRKVFVKPTDEAAAAISEMAAPNLAPTKEAAVAESAPPDPDLPDEEADDAPAAAGADDSESLEDDPIGESSDTFLVKQPGTFYDQPKRNSQKYGRLEPNDQVEVISSSQDEKWARVRLIETGEEGWVPKTRIGRKVPRSELSQLEAPSGKLWHIGASGVMAPEPWNFGFLMFIRRGFESLSIGTTPIEIGFGGGLNVGSTEEIGNSELSVSYVDMRLYAHWEPLLSPRFGLPVELGMLYKYGAISTDLSQEQFESLDTRIMQSEFGGFIGLGVTYFFADWFRLEVIPQIQLTSSVDLVLNAGAVISF